MRAYRKTPQTTTEKRANLMMYELELRLHDQLQGYPPSTKVEFSHEYVIWTKEFL